MNFYGNHISKISKFVSGTVFILFASLPASGIINEIEVPQRVHKAFDVLNLDLSANQASINSRFALLTREMNHSGRLEELKPLAEARMEALKFAKEQSELQGPKDTAGFKRLWENLYLWLSEDEEQLPSTYTNLTSVFPHLFPAQFDLQDRAQRRMTLSHMLEEPAETVKFFKTKNQELNPVQGVFAREFSLYLQMNSLLHPDKVMAFETEIVTALENPETSESSRIQLLFYMTEFPLNAERSYLALYKFAADDQPYSLQREARRGLQAWSLRRGLPARLQETFVKMPEGSYAEWCLVHSGTPLTPTIHNLMLERMMAMHNPLLSLKMAKAWLNIQREPEASATTLRRLRDSNSVSPGIRAEAATTLLRDGLDDGHTLSQMQKLISSKDALALREIIFWCQKQTHPPKSIMDSLNQITWEPSTSLDSAQIQDFKNKIFRINLRIKQNQLMCPEALS